MTDPKSNINLRKKKTKEDLRDMNNKVCCIFSFLEEDWKLD